MNTSLNFSIDELVKLNDNVVDSKDGIKNVLSSINGELNELSANVTGTQANNLINDITTKIQNIDGNMQTSFEQLTTFLNEQMKNYQVTYEEGYAILEKALSFINSSFGVN